MANITLRSTDGNDADDGSSWALAKATLQAALTAAGAGGVVWMSQAHAEAPAVSTTLTSPGTAAAPTIIICVNDGAYPPTTPATTGSLICTTNNNALTYAGHAIVIGVTFRPGPTGGSASHNLGTGGVNWSFVNCLLDMGNNASASMSFSANSTNELTLKLINTVLKFGNVSQKVNIGNIRFEWLGGSVDPAGSAPTVLFDSSGSTQRPFSAIVQGVDLSHLGSGKSILNVGNSTAGDFLAYGCKYGASVAEVTGSFAGRGAVHARFINSDSSDTNYRRRKAVYEGDITQETVIVRTGGASDGTTPLSFKFVSTANSVLYFPLMSDWYQYWNESLSSITLNVETVTDNITLTDAEAWVEVIYPGVSGVPQYTLITDRVSSILATAANQDSSTETWTTTGLTTPVKQKFSVTFTPQEKGPIYARVCLAKPSTTMYTCPEILTNAGRSYMTLAGYINEGVMPPVNMAKVIQGIGTY